MNKNSNSYTFIFAIVMVIVVATALAFAATSLSERQSTNVREEKMQSILHTVGIDSVMQDGKKVYLSRPMAGKSFDKYIVKQLALRDDGSVDKSANAFKVDLARELKMPYNKQIYPLYVAKVDGKQYYIIPLRGFGLWDAIWGYISIEDDINTVKGAVFDHKGETAGLGAEITKDWFQANFKGKKIFTKDGELVGVSVIKGYASDDPNAPHEVDAISGATITGNGVTNMIAERLKHYIPYFKKHTDVKISSK